ncbi:MAG: histidine phosphatase family protein [Oligoflexia bacterium]|nr:histidine phosphatase family protein [Oligoflexia bacterium]
MKMNCFAFYSCLVFGMATGILCTPGESWAGNIYVFRHGEGFHNIHKIWSTNPLNKEHYIIANLTPLGEQQVIANAEKLLKDPEFDKNKIDTVFFSPLPRTIQTSKSIIKTLGIPDNKRVVAPEIIEINLGDHEGLSQAEFEKLGWMKELANGKKTHDYQFGHLIGGENEEDLDQRVESFLINKILLQDDLDNKDYILVSHWHTSQRIIQFFDPTNIADLSTGNYAIIPKEMINAKALEIKQALQEGKICLEKKSSSFVTKLYENIKEILAQGDQEKVGVDHF